MIKYLVSVVLISGILISSSFAADAPQKEEIVIKSANKPMLGVVITPVDDDELKELKLHGGAKIKKVRSDTEAERIGLQKDDIIIKFDGNDIADPEDLFEMISDIEDEKKVEIVVMRDGKEKKFEADLKPGEEGSNWAWSGDGDFDFDFRGLPHHLGENFTVGGKGGFLGVETEELTDQLKAYFEVENGVLVEKVLEDSPAEKAGLKAGDVITQINDRKIGDYHDLVRTVNYYDPGETVEVKYSRKGKSNSVKVELGERKKMKWHQFRVGDDVESSLLDLDNHFEKNLKGNLRMLKDNLKGLKENVDRIRETVVVI